MNRLSRLSLIPMLMTLICAAPMGAQDSEKINSSLGSVVSVPMGPTSDLATLGWGFTAGVGYNPSRRNSVIGEFLWNRLYSTSGAAIANGAGGSSGGASDIYSVTGNYRFELRGKKFGTYFIGGGAGISGRIIWNIRLRLPLVRPAQRLSFGGAHTAPRGR